MPLPNGLRSFRPEVQAQLRDIYYQRDKSYEQKLSDIGKIIMKLPRSETADFWYASTAVNDNMDSGLVYFEINGNENYKGYYVCRYR